MVIRPRLRSFFTALCLYVLAALLIGYFGINAYTGNHGLRARADLDQQIAELNAEVAQVKAEREQWQRRRGRPQYPPPRPCTPGKRGPGGPHYAAPPHPPIECEATQPHAHTTPVPQHTSA